MIAMSGAQFDILVDGTPRSYRDRKDIAIASAEFLKHRNPHSEVKVRAGRAAKYRVQAEAVGQGPQPGCVIRRVFIGGPLSNGGG